MTRKKVILFKRYIPSGATKYHKMTYIQTATATSNDSMYSNVCLKQIDNDRKLCSNTVLIRCYWLQTHQIVIHFFPMSTSVDLFLYRPSHHHFNLILMLKHHIQKKPIDHIRRWWHRTYAIWSIRVFSVCITHNEY